MSVRLPREWTKGTPEDGKTVLTKHARSWHNAKFRGPFETQVIISQLVHQVVGILEAFRLVNAEGEVRIRFHDTTYDFEGSLTTRSKVDEERCQILLTTVDALLQKIRAYHQYITTLDYELKLTLENKPAPVPA